LKRKEIQGCPDFLVSAPYEKFTRCMSFLDIPEESCGRIFAAGQFESAGWKDSLLLSKLNVKTESCDHVSNHSFSFLSFAAGITRGSKSPDQA
jgi:hypothetical protein